MKKSKRIRKGWDDEVAQPGERLTSYGIQCARAGRLVSVAAFALYYKANARASALIQGYFFAGYNPQTRFTQFRLKILELVRLQYDEVPDNTPTEPSPLRRVETVEGSDRA